MVSDLAKIKPIMNLIKIDDLQSELPAYLAAAMHAPPRSNSLDDVAAYSESILSFWRHTSEKSMHAWRSAARILFGISPNSASCERVFAMVACKCLEKSRRVALPMRSKHP